MQAQASQRTLRDLFDTLQAQGETDAAAGVYLAAKKLYLPLTTWHLNTSTVKAAYRVTQAARS